MDDTVDKLNAGDNTLTSPLVPGLHNRCKPE